MSCENTSSPSNTSPPRQPWQDQDAPAKARVCLRLQVVYTHRSTQPVENVKLRDHRYGATRTTLRGHKKSLPANLAGKLVAENTLKS